MTTNVERLNAAVTLALADVKFMGDKTKVDKAIVALTPKSTVTATFKRLQGNALSDFLVKKDEMAAGYTDETKADKIKEYVHDRFKSYMEAFNTSAEATKLFNAAYPLKTKENAPAGDSAAE